MSEQIGMGGRDPGFALGECSATGGLTMRGNWPETIALILRDCDPEARLEFMRALGAWKRNSTATIRKNSEVNGECYEEDLRAAEARMVKLQALEEHLHHEMESMARWRGMLDQMWRDVA